MIRRLLPWVAAIGVAAISLAFFAWLIVAQQIEERTLAWAEARKAEGYTLAWQSFDVGGFPFRFELAFAEPRIGRNGWTAEAPRLEASYRPWRPDRIDLAAPRLSLAGPDGAGSIEQARGEVRLEGGQATQVAIEGAAATARIRTDDLGRADRARLVVDGFSPAADGAQNETISGSMSLWGAKPNPPLAEQLLFPDPFDFAATGAIKGPLADLAAWRDAGGTIDLSRVVLVWGPVKLDGNATLALDGQMRLLGAGTAKVQGVTPLLDRLVSKGQVRPQDASVAKVVLGLLAKPTADGGSEITVPITAQDGKLFLGPAAVATLRPLGSPKP